MEDLVRVKDDFKKLNINLNDDFLLTVQQYYNDIKGSSRGIPIKEFIFYQWLYCDIGDSCTKSPSVLNVSEDGIVKVSHILQVNWAIPIDCSLYSIYTELSETKADLAWFNNDEKEEKNFLTMPSNNNNDKNENRILLMELTDGIDVFQAVGKEPIKGLQSILCPGLKMVVCGDVYVNNKILYIDNKVSLVLGGEVAELYNRNNTMSVIERKLHLPSSFRLQVKQVQENKKKRISLPEPSEASKDIMKQWLNKSKVSDTNISNDSLSFLDKSFDRSDITIGSSMNDSNIDIDKSFESRYISSENSIKISKKSIDDLLNSTPDKQDKFKKSNIYKEQKIYGYLTPIKSGSSISGSNKLYNPSTSSYKGASIFNSKIQYSKKNDNKVHKSPQRDNLTLNFNKHSPILYDDNMDKLSYERVTMFDTTDQRSIKNFNDINKSSSQKMSTMDRIKRIISPKSFKNKEYKNSVISSQKSLNDCSIRRPLSLRTDSQDNILRNMPNHYQSFNTISQNEISSPKFKDYTEVNYDNNPHNLKKKNYGLSSVSSLLSKKLSPNFSSIIPPFKGPSSNRQKDTLSSIAKFLKPSKKEPKYKDNINKKSLTGSDDFLTNDFDMKPTLLYKRERQSINLPLEKHSLFDGQIIDEGSTNKTYIHNSRNSFNESFGRLSNNYSDRYNNTTTSSSEMDSESYVFGTSKSNLSLTQTPLRNTKRIHLNTSNNSDALFTPPQKVPKFNQSQADLGKRNEYVTINEAVNIVSMSFGVEKVAIKGEVVKIVKNLTTQNNLWTMDVKLMDENESSLICQIHDSFISEFLGISATEGLAIKRSSNHAACKDASKRVDFLLKRLKMKDLIFYIDMYASQSLTPVIRKIRTVKQVENEIAASQFVSQQSNNFF
uniref:RecQ-mediated genome instability protein 1 n=1 Tax=Parastrongyloides trichosuri TaxID=131310 RepID=A0A0N4ZXG0_PARTI